KLYWTENKTIKEMSFELGTSTYNVRRLLKKYNLTDTKRERKLPEAWNKGKTYKMSLTPEQKLARSNKAKKNARRGPESNFWKGGVLDKRGKVTAWLNSNRQIILARDNYMCQITGKKQRLELHHIVPLWMDDSDEMTMNIDNILTLSHRAHKKIHSLNLEKTLIKWIEEGKDLTIFFKENAND